MFEAAELGRTVSKAVYNKKDPELRTALLDAQFKLRELPFPVIIIVSGVEGAGKGEVVNELNRWFDTRGVQTHVFWGESDEEHERPRFWRFWRKLPPKSTIGVLFGSWYTTPIIDRVFGKRTKAEFESELDRISEFERLLSNDGALIIKFWFHLTKKAPQTRPERGQGLAATEGIRQELQSFQSGLGDRDPSHRQRIQPVAYRRGRRSALP